MLKRVLIANRGEVARRIGRTCRRLGVDYVAVYSAADADSAHVDDAVDVVAIDGYLNIESLVDAAMHTGCDAVHPGYGFLSENPKFAEAVADAGLVYIGPDARVIADMGDKAAARELMAAAGVPVLPGSEAATESADVLAEDARRIGYPVILKPVAGGGGKGMKVVSREADLPAAVAEAVRLGRSSFGDGRLLAERYVARPRHLEVQVFGDVHGSVVHLHERECSLQRRHQKIVEEAPSVNLPGGVREALLEAAVRGAKALGYVNAGTFEFIVDEQGGFFFLEANTRLQVEHPVTEEITGVDLVEWQLLVADGQPLPLRQDEITARGHAVEVRVYAEDPEAGFRPAPGRAEIVEWPSGIRVEAAFDEPAAVSGFYDPMIAKLIASGPDRSTALARLGAAVRSTRLIGLTSNLGFLANLLDHPRVTAGRVDTHLVDEFVAAAEPQDRTRLAVAAAAAMTVPRATNPWSGSVGPLDRVHVDARAPLGRVTCHDGERVWQASLLDKIRGRLVVEVDGVRCQVTAELSDKYTRGTVGDAHWSGLRTGTGFEIVVDGYRIALADRTFTGESETADDVVRTAMPGTVVGVPCEPGRTVEAGETLVIVEAMKMENRLPAPRSGVVGEIRCRPGELVAAGQVLVVLAETETTDHKKTGDRA